ncbi:conserved hypothetical protein [Pseudomonas veronii]|uniref:hypothetical protein n=1 Tax=Pseudomonas veronii TaxID=76761 RepID=UPI00177350E2|nr:hypothetical protein [Pseudomonas veronii]CAD0264191.1 conserved hypothetical protein [Pseudomonas veronii]
MDNLSNLGTPLELTVEGESPHVLGTGHGTLAFSLDSEIKELLKSPAASDWLKESLSLALKRDCVDAANDAEVLSDLLNRRCEEITKAALSRM